MAKRKDGAYPKPFKQKNKKNNGNFLSFFFEKGQIFFFPPMFWTSFWGLKGIVLKIFKLGKQNLEENIFLFRFKPLICSGPNLVGGGYFEIAKPHLVVQVKDLEAGLFRFLLLIEGVFSEPPTFFSPLEHFRY